MARLIGESGYHATLVEGRTAFRFVISDRKLCSFLKGFGRYTHDRRLTGQCFTLDAERKKALYEGYLSADGYTDTGDTMKAITVSRELALGIAQIARDIFHRPVSISRKTCRRECVIERRRANERPQYCVTVSPSEKYGYYKDGFVWCLVKNVEYEYE